MRVWLDDERDPNSPLIQQRYGALPDMVWVSTAQAAIDLLKTGNVTYISLDHDLSIYQGEETGQVVADWIERNAYEKTLKELTVRVHSDNPVGRKRMLMAIRNAKRFWRESAAEQQRILSELNRLDYEWDQTLKDTDGDPFGVRNNE